MLPARAGAVPLLAGATRRGAAAGGARQRTVLLGALVLIGTDCPALTTTVLRRAFEALEHSDVVFGPARDGGYYLVGLRRPMRDRKSTRLNSSHYS